MYINLNLIIINQYTAVLDWTPGPGLVQVRVRGPQKVPGPDLDRTLDSLINDDWSFEDDETENWQHVSMGGH